MKKELKTKLAKETNGHCGYCGIDLLMNVKSDELINLEPADYARLWSVDHLVPTSRGGTNDDENLMICCKKCNSIKGTKTLLEFRLWLQKGLSESLSKTVLDHFLKYTDFYTFSAGEYAILETNLLGKNIIKKIGQIKFFFDKI